MKNIFNNQENNNISALECIERYLLRHNDFSELESQERIELISAITAFQIIKNDLIQKSSEIRNKKFYDTLDYPYCFKKVLSFKEGCKYCDIAESSMYKHTSNGTVSYYKPHGKLIFFKREDLDNWMLQNRHSTSEELENEAISKSFKADWRTKFKSK